jgi:hypothetical protein
MPPGVTIDLVTHDPATDEYVLYLVEDGPWPVREAEWKPHLKAIQDRILSAIDIAIDGQLANRYPDSVRKGIRVQIDSPHGCPEPLEKLIAAIKGFLRTDPSYLEAITGSSFFRGLRVITGKQLGRFRTDPKN